jgi:hypothetical protein
MDAFATAGGLAVPDRLVTKLQARGDEFVENSAGRLALEVAKEAFGRRVPQHHPPFEIGEDGGSRTQLQD